ncbi:NAD(+) diphosphatase [Frondihabitans australicus]|uniref:NAD(+) diphosphatase n=1 Tax=Frondihabitans australicus TaxID=386892 RepID=A0A495IHE7_9MICO|nr:NAD(+) diphosphatase [Frondihabitans australicus]RKR74878.1 NAD+ diphosphatase [Frondihabitans australicus]
MPARSPEDQASFTDRLPLSRHTVDRDYLARERDDLFTVLMADAATRVLPVWKGRALFRGETALNLVEPAAVPADARLVYLGRSTSDDDLPAGTAFVAALLTDEQASSVASEDEWGNLRMFATGLSARDAGLATEALAITNWHASHRFSPRTGKPLLSTKGGWVLVDPDDGHEVFPRTDPAIIVGVTDADDRLLLGSNAMWEKNRYSLLAGFVEPGESLEQAVQREIFEESGVRVVDPVYLGSQPWPFPASLMLGFRATVDVDDPGSLEPDGAEIVDLRWFTRDELIAAGDSVILPGRSSIARAIIEDWYGSEIDD